MSNPLLVGLTTPMGLAVSIALGAIAVAALALAVAVYVRDAQRRRDALQSGSSPETWEPELPSGGSRAAATQEPVADDDETLPIAAPSSLTRPVEAPAMPALTEALAAEQKGEWLKAAELYRQRSDFVAERRALRRTSEHLRLAELETALGDHDKAAEAFRAVLEQDPTSEDIRLRLIQALLDSGRLPDARRLVDSLRDGGDRRSIKAGAPFLMAAARCFQAVGDFQMAIDLCNAAFARNSSLADVATRTIYLNKMLLLARTPPPRPTGEIGQKFMAAVFEGEDDTRSPFLSQQNMTQGDGPGGIDTLLAPYEVVVGHIALGGHQSEMKVSVRSAASPSSRLELLRLIGERPASVVFEGVDRLLDCPVAVRLSRISTEGNDAALIAKRIRAIAQLNHPNLSKITFADRFGPVVRVVSEYHGGGTLAGLLDRLEQLGLPLALRLLLQISAGLHAAHKHGILHGDLRLENVMVGHDNLIKIIDFALSPWPVHSVRSDDSTHPGQPGRGIPAAEIQSDVIQFADILEAVARKVMLASIPKTPVGWDPMDEFREVVERARSGGFSSVSPIHRILLEILDKCLPNTR